MEGIDCTDETLVKRSWDICCCFPGRHSHRHITYCWETVVLSARYRCSFLENNIRVYYEALVFPPRERACGLMVTKDIQMVTAQDAWPLMQEYCYIIPLCSIAHTKKYLRWISLAFRSRCEKMRHNSFMNNPFTGYSEGTFEPCACTLYQATGKPVFSKRSPNRIYLERAPEPMGFFKHQRNEAAFLHALDEVEMRTWHYNAGRRNSHRNIMRLWPNAKRAFSWMYVWTGL